MADLFAELFGALTFCHVAIIEGTSIGPKIIAHSLQRIALIFNPAAGGLKGAARDRLDAAVKCFRDAGRTVELLPTTGPGMAGELGRQAAGGGFDTVLAAGGDGTINEVMNGIVGTSIAFGALPAGTANVLANEIGLKCRPDEAAPQLLEAEPVRIGVGAWDQPGQARRHFLMMAGIGLDARIVHELDLDLKRRMGKLAYWHGGLRQVGRAQPDFTISSNGTEHKVGFALLSRVRNYGGDFEIARSVRLIDPDFEVVTLAHRGFSDYFRFLGGVILNRLDKVDGVTVSRGQDAFLAPCNGQPVYVQADGEAIGTLPGRISIVPDSVTLLLPSEYLRRAVK